MAHPLLALVLALAPAQGGPEGPPPLPLAGAWFKLKVKGKGVIVDSSTLEVEKGGAKLIAYMLLLPAPPIEGGSSFESPYQYTIWTESFPGLEDWGPTGGGLFNVDGANTEVSPNVELALESAGASLNAIHTAAMKVKLDENGQLKSAKLKTIGSDIFASTFIDTAAESSTARVYGSVKVSGKTIDFLDLPFETAAAAVAREAPPAPAPVAPPPIFSNLYLGSWWKLSVNTRGIAVDPVSEEIVKGKFKTTAYMFLRELTAGSEGGPIGGYVYDIWTETGEDVWTPTSSNQFPVDGLGEQLVVNAPLTFYFDSAILPFVQAWYTGTLKAKLDDLGALKSARMKTISSVLVDSVLGLPSAEALSGPNYYGAMKVGGKTVPIEKLPFTPN